MEFPGVVSIDTKTKNVDISIVSFELTSIFHSLELKTSMKTIVLFLRYQILKNHPYDIIG